MDNFDYYKLFTIVYAHGEADRTVPQAPPKSSGPRRANQSCLELGSLIQTAQRLCNFPATASKPAEDALRLSKPASHPVLQELDRNVGVEEQNLGADQLLLTSIAGRPVQCYAMSLHVNISSTMCCICLWSCTLRLAEYSITIQVKTTTTELAAADIYSKSETVTNFLKDLSARSTTTPSLSAPQAGSPPVDVDGCSDVRGSRSHCPSVLYLAFHLALHLVHLVPSSPFSRNILDRAASSLSVILVS